MALDVNHPLSSEPDSEHSPGITLDPINDYHSNPHQTSPLPSQTLQQNIRQPCYYPIFDPPKINLQRFAEEKAAAMAQYDDEI